MDQAKFKKILLHPVVLTAGPVILTIIILMALRVFGLHYRDLPFLYSYF